MTVWHEDFTEQENLAIDMLVDRVKYNGRWYYKTCLWISKEVGVPLRWLEVNGLRYV